jgi:hypothetical protein
MTAYMESLTSATPEEIAKLKDALDEATKDVEAALAVGRKCNNIRKLLR